MTSVTQNVFADLFMRVGSFSCCKSRFISLQHYSDFNGLQLIFPARNNGFASQNSYIGRMKGSQIRIGEIKIE